MSAHDDGLAEWFDRVVGLDPEARAHALDAAGLDPALRAELEALLLADHCHDTRLDRVLAGAARRLDEVAAPLPADGATIGAWCIERELGAGGMGTVFLARRADAGDEQRGALKLLRGFPTEEGRQRLRQERRVLATLEHPYIARLIDGGETTDGQPYFVMEFVEGESATAFAAQRSLNVAARVGLIDRIAEAVAHAHQRLVIHRDLKPSNVLVRGDGTPRVLDFGVAKLLDVAGDTAGTSTRVWTPGYASPEQRSGRPVTTATDVYALGVLLRELLTGKRPDGASCAPPLPSVAIDADLAGVLNKATAELPAERYPTVEALRDDLARWGDGRPVRAARDTALYRARKFLVRHRLGTALVALAVAATGVFVVGLERALREARLARDAALTAQRDAETQRVIAQRVGDFMTRMFERSNSTNTSGKVLTARDVIATAAEELKRDTTLDPASRAVLQERLATTLVVLRDIDGARSLIELAQRDRDALTLTQSALLDHTQARILARLDRDEEAEALNRRGLAAIEADPSNPTIRVRLLQQAMWLANRRRDFQHTLELAPRALAAWERDPERERSLRSAILNTRFVAEHALGLNTEMLTSLRQAWNDIRQAQGSDALARANTGANLADALIDLGHAEEAGTLLDELEPFVREVFTADLNIVLVRVLRIRGDSWLARGHAERALQLIDEAEGVAQRLDPSLRPTAYLGLSRVNVLLAQQRWSEVIAVLDRTWGGSQPPPPEGQNGIYARAYAARAIALCRTDRAADAAFAAAAARTILAALPPTQIERQIVERQLSSLDAQCRVGA